MDNYSELECTITIEDVDKNGKLTSKRRILNNAFVKIYRNEFRDLLLKIDKHIYEFKNYEIFTKFLKVGKATIIFNKKTSIMFSNAPPEKLATFFKILKVKSNIQKTFSTDKMKLYSNKSVLDEISPLTLQDVKTFRQNTKESRKTSKQTSITPVRTKRPSNQYDDGLPRKRLNNAVSPLVKLGQPSNAATLKTKTKTIKELNQTISSITDEEKLKKKINLVGKLTKEQNEVLKVVKSGLSIFFTGSAGTGKSFLLKKIIGIFPPDTTVASASTGVAACQIGGMTIHSFAGIGSGDHSIEECIRLASRPAAARNWKRCKTLIIDEISMIDCALFEKLEKVARVVRNNPYPFGGIQLIVCGDFLQLPPVQQKKDYQFCFQSKCWTRCIQQSFELTEVKRQSDREFINILQHVRVGKCTEEIYERLVQTQNHVIERDGVRATRLCTHKENVETINEEQMKKLTTPPQVFNSSDSDMEYKNQLDKVCPVLNKIELKVGAQVMLAKNLDVFRGLVNGARGVVTKFQHGLPIVKFVSGEEVTIKREKFVIKTAIGPVTRFQLPLKLAWAISIHKSQGLTLDCCEVSLSRVFEHGQAYVALSRAKSLDGLRVIDINRTCIRANKEVLKFYIKLRREIRMNENYKVSDE